MTAGLQTDVAVIGGGLAGLAAARFLAERGVRVEVFERGTIGSRAPGIVRQGLHVPFLVACKILGEPRTRDLWRLTMENRELAKKFERVDVRGSYVLATAAEVDGLQSCEFGERWIEPDRLPATIDRSRFIGALFTPGDGEVDVAKLMQSLARGLTVHENCEVTALVDQPQSVRVVCRRETEAELVVLATNAETPRLSGFFEDVIFPVRQSWRRTSAIPPGAIPAPLFANFGREVYRQLGDGRVLASGHEPALGELIPMARTARVEERWDLVRGLSCDELPCVGPLPGAVRLHALCGWHGNEMSLSLVCAKMAADLITTGTSDLPFRMFDPRRHTL